MTRSEVTYHDRLARSGLQEFWQGRSMTWCDVWLWWRFTVVLQACLLPGMFAAAHRASLSVPIESVCAGYTVLTLDPATGSMIEAEVLAAGATRRRPRERAALLPRAGFER